MVSNVESLIQEFVINLRAAIAEEAAQAFIIAGGGALSAKPGRKSKGSSAAQPKRKVLKRKGGKRTAEEIEEQGATILAYLQKNPGSGAEQIGAALGMSTAELALPVAKLLKQKSLKHVGQKRGRKYSAK
jgi:hypothetical protein